MLLLPHMGKTTVGYRAIMRAPTPMASTGAREAGSMRPGGGNKHSKSAALHCSRITRGWRSLPRRRRGIPLPCRVAYTHGPQASPRRECIRFSRTGCVVHVPSERRAARTSIVQYSLRRGRHPAGRALGMVDRPRQWSNGTRPALPDRVDDGPSVLLWCAAIPRRSGIRAGGRAADAPAVILGVARHCIIERGPTVITSHLHLTGEARQFFRH
jgi:hypothetical protein